METHLRQQQQHPYFTESESGPQDSNDNNRRHSPSPHRPAPSRTASETNQPQPPFDHPPTRPSASHQADVRELVDLLSRRVEEDRVEGAVRSAKFRQLEQQQEAILQHLAAQIQDKRAMEQQQQQRHHGRQQSGGGGGSSSVVSAARSLNEMPPGVSVDHRRLSLGGGTSVSQGRGGAADDDSDGGPQRLQAAIRKTEHLAKLLVKTLRERNSFEEAVGQLSQEHASLRERLSQLHNVASERDTAHAELRAAKESLQRRTEEVQHLRAELRQRTAALERQGVNERESRRLMLSEKEAMLAQVTQQLHTLVAEHEALVSANDDMFFACEKAATELKSAHRRGQEFEQRALAAERALEVERAARIAAESSSVNGPPDAWIPSSAAVGETSGDGGAERGGSSTPVSTARSPGERSAPTSPAAAPSSATRSGQAAPPPLDGTDRTGASTTTATESRLRVQRLEARLRADAATHTEALRRVQEAATTAAEGRDAAELRLSEMEITIRHLKRELANAVRDGTTQALAAQSARQRLLGVKQDALAVTNRMTVSRNDTDFLAQRYSDDDVLAPFIDHVSMDLTHLAHFLASLRSLDTDPPAVPVALSPVPMGFSGGRTPVRSLAKARSPSAASRVGGAASRADGTTVTPPQVSPKRRDSEGVESLTAVVRRLDNSGSTRQQRVPPPPPPPLQ